MYRLLLLWYLSSSCTSYTNLDSAFPLEKGESRTAVGLGIINYRSTDQSQDVDQLVETFYFPFLELGFSYGLTSKFSLGLKYTTPTKGQLNIKYSLTEKSQQAVSTGLILGYGKVTYDGQVEEQDLVIKEIIFPLYFSKILSQKTMFHTSLQFIRRENKVIAKNVLADESSEVGHFVGVSLGASYRRFFYELGIFAAGTRNYFLIYSIAFDFYHD